MSEDRSPRAQATGGGATASEGLDTVSRRAFLAGSAGLWISLSIPRPLAAAALPNAAPQALEPLEWQAVEAITARILPTDDLPGAVEAGCVSFIDKALAHEDAAALPAYRSALRELDRVCRRAEGDRFAALEPAVQDRILAALEAGRLAGWSPEAPDPVAFFATIRMHTILGFVLDPRHGGNRDYVGWQVMGYPGPVHHLGGAQPEQMLGKVPFVPIWERQAIRGRDADAAAPGGATPPAASPRPAHSDPSHR